MRAKTLLAISIVLMGTSALAQDPARVLDDSVQISLLTDELPSNLIRVDYHPGLAKLFVMRRTGEIGVLDPRTGDYEAVFSGDGLGIAEPSGFGISPEGDFFVVGNTRDGVWVTGALKRASLTAGGDALTKWTTVMETVPYPLAANYNHLMSALVVDPSGEWVYINSGSRTDHGEVQDNFGAHPETREVPLTSVILRVPANAQDLVLPNDADSLEAGGFLFARGVRNHFDMAFGPNGHLFGVENSGDRDDTEELNWLQEGEHYGFPWRVGTNDTPQQFEDYDPAQDLLINPSSGAAQLGLFENDPSYPPAPEGVEFVDPIPNMGPDAVEFRDSETGAFRDGAVDGVAVGSFTPHKSLLALVFDTAGVLADPYNGDGFVFGWNNSESALLSPFQDPGEDLLHLKLRFGAMRSDDYTMGSRRIGDSFSMPIDAVLVDTSLFVIEITFGGPARGWRLDFGRKAEPPPSGVSTNADDVPGGVDVDVFPNPASTYLYVQLTERSSDPIDIEMLDVTGRRVWRASRAGHDARRVEVPVHNLPAGVYLVRAAFGSSITNQLVTVINLQ